MLGPNIAIEEEREREKKQEQELKERHSPAYYTVALPLATCGQGLR